MWRNTCFDIMQPDVVNCICAPESKIEIQLKLTWHSVQCEMRDISDVSVMFDIYSRLILGLRRNKVGKGHPSQVSVE